MKESIKTELDYYWSLLWNILWIVTIAAAFVITAIAKDIVDFYFGVLIFCVFGLIIAIALLPISRKVDKLKKELIK